MKKRLSIETGYNIFAFIATLVIILLLANQLYREFDFIQSEQKLVHLAEANKIAVVVNENFDYLENFDRFIADKIAYLPDLNKEAISQILGYRSQEISINIGLLTWTLADFVTPDGEIITARHVKKRDSPNIGGKRGWDASTKSYPWMLHFDKPDDGITSGEYVIPTGFGVTSYSTKQFLGTISTGISVDKLNAKIIEHLGDNIEFVILDRDLNPISFSTTVLKETNFKEFGFIIKNPKSDEGEFDSEFRVSNIDFKYYKQDKKYHYIVLIGTYNKTEWQLIIHNLIANFNYSLGALLVFIILLYFFNKILLSPIKQLSDNALAMARGEKFRYKPSIRTQDAEYLSEALAMVEDLLVREHEINDKLSSTKTALQTLNNVLELRSIELEQSLKANTEFVNNVSHEVRTPIHGISLLSKGLVDNWDQIDKKTSYTLAVKIAHNAQRLLSMVSNLLDISKLKYGEIQLNFHHVNLNQLIIDMIEECRSLYMSNRDIVIKLHAIDDIAAIVDPDKITQVLRNLLSNAIKVTACGTIIVGISRVGDTAEIYVKDEGVGIPEDELQIIFDSFEQSSRTKGKVSGIGLGLTISQKIIEAHGGKIWGENNKHKGAKFTFTLPIAKDLKPIIRAQKIDKKLLCSMSTKANIMIVDDEDTCILGVQMIVHNTNYKLFEYMRAGEALKFLEENPKTIDIVMIDMMMPEMPGLEMLQKIKSNPKLGHISVIMQSGIADESQINLAWQHGAVDFIRKPYTQETFIVSVERVLKERK